MNKRGRRVSVGPVQGSTGGIRDQHGFHQRGFGITTKCSSSELCPGQDKLPEQNPHQHQRVHDDASNNAAIAQGHAASSHRSRPPFTPWYAPDPSATAHVAAFAACWRAGTGAGSRSNPTPVPSASASRADPVRLVCRPLGTCWPPRICVTKAGGTRGQQGS